MGEQGAHMEQVADRFRWCRESLPIGFWLVDSRLHNRCQLWKRKYNYLLSGKIH